MADTPPKRFIYQVTFGDPADFDKLDRTDIWNLIHTAHEVFADDVSAMNRVWAEAETFWAQAQQARTVYPGTAFPGVVYKHASSNDREWAYRLRNNEDLPFDAFIHLCEVKR